MRSFLILVVLVVIGVTGLFIMANNAGNEEDKEVEALIARHCALNWEEADGPTKLQVLNEFGQKGGIEDTENRLPLSLVAYNLLEQSVRYPETILIDEEKPQGFILLNNNYVIASVPEGLIDFRKSFTAKNKLNMDVRMQMFMQVKYNAGCNGFEVVQFNVE